MPGIAINTRGNIAKDLYEFSQTLDDDPGRHKLKAILGTGATALGTAYVALKKAQTPFNPVNRSLVSTLLSYTVPAAIYYAVQNRDRLGRAAAGTGVALIAGNKNMKYNSELPIDTMPPEEKRKALIQGGIGVMAIGAPALYALHHLQQARDLEKLKNIKNDTTMSPIDKAMEINRIKTKKDMLTRYPALAGVPGASIARSIYNSFHKPEPIVSQSDAIEYNLLPSAPPSLDAPKQ